MKYLLYNYKARLIFLVLFVVLFPIISEAQEAQKTWRIDTNIPYTFSSESSVYKYIDGGIIVPSLSADDAISSWLDIGFPFQFGCETYTRFYASSNGIFTFNYRLIGPVNENSPLSSWDSNITLLAPLWDDLNGEGGTFSYKTIGTAPNRIFTAEWKNWKWLHVTSPPVISFQVKLYEGTNTIEYVYNQETSNKANASASIGMFNENTLNAAAKQLWLNNSSKNPVASINFTDTINTSPASGQVYRFIRNDTDDSCKKDYYGQTIINPKGGKNVNDGLRITLSGSANMQIRKFGSGQIFNTYNEVLYGTSIPYEGPARSVSSIHGVVLSVGNTYFSGGTLTPSGTTKLEVVSSTQQSLIESPVGHFVNEIKLAAVKNDLTYYLTIKYVYDFPENYFFIDYTVTIPEGNTEEVKLAHGWDSYFVGGKEEPGFVSGTAPNLVVGVKRPSPYAYYQAFEYIGGVPWSGYFAAHYNLLNIDLGRDMTFKNTINPGPSNNGIGISMNFGKIPGSFTSSNKLVFACNAGNVAPAVANKGGICQGMVLDLNSLITSSTPPGAVVVWKDAKGAVVTDPITVTTAGTYTVYYHSEKYNCDSPTATIVVKQDTSCGVCYKPGVVNGAQTSSPLAVISTLDRKNHPAVNPRNGALILESKEKGFAINKVASPETAIAVPVEGMLVYDTTSNCLKLYNGIIWNCIEQTCVDNN
ncbi:hypothetical protein [Flavobacterium sp. 140616W15]|uniref:hypothetical protein n=1 Tax=Flavobacterium sp. 140616W15 TaxID=2478552 RepID=UPI000F0C7BBF|nr:hypothetical protein [Flavobacterium sp. 140616W15]AYN03812.1 hypothetical protein EAG11_06165 [Flavobacterium sp. 140616W15]